MKIIHAIAIILIIAGFGIIHNKSRMLEIAGSVSIGIGTLYFLILLLVNQNKGEE